MNEIILSIPEPCRENWNEMSATAKGRFCSHCSKEVIDFSGSSDNEIIRYVENNKGRLLCGQFNEMQLNRRLLSSNIKNTHPGLYKYLISILLLTASQNLAAQEKKKEEIVNVPQQAKDCEGFIESPPAAAIPPLPTPNVAPKPLILRGIISTGPNPEPLLVVDGIAVRWAQLKKFPKEKIKHIEILKGGQAATLFGAEAINGAIVITTTFTEKERRRYIRNKK